MAAVAGTVGLQQPAERDAWFAGWQGGLAVCLFVEQGSSGGEMAARLAS